MQKKQAKQAAWLELLRIWKSLDEMQEVKRNRARASYKKYNCPVVNLSLLMRDEMEKYLCGDGIH